MLSGLLYLFTFLSSLSLTHDLCLCNTIGWKALKASWCNMLQTKLPVSDSGIQINCVCCCIFSDLTRKRLHHVTCTLCNCQNSEFVYLTWPLKACNNIVLMQTYNKTVWHFVQQNKFFALVGKSRCPCKGECNLISIPHPSLLFLASTIYSANSFHNLFLMFLRFVMSTSFIHLSLNYVWRAVCGLIVVLQIIVNVERIHLQC